MTSAFIAAIYAIVAASVIGTGGLDRWISLPVSVGAIAALLVLPAFTAGARHLAAGPRHAPASRRR